MLNQQGADQVPTPQAQAHISPRTRTHLQMADETYDLVTIGAGSGGVRASRFSAQLYGAKVACVELPFGFISSETVGGAGGT